MAELVAADEIVRNIGVAYVAAGLVLVPLGLAGWGHRAVVLLVALTSFGYGLYVAIAEPVEVFGGLYLICGPLLVVLYALGERFARDDRELSGDQPYAPAPTHVAPERHRP